MDFYKILNMFAFRKRNFKLFTIVLFAATITSLFVNYSQHSDTALWRPEKYIFRFSEQLKRFVAFSKSVCSCETCVAESEISAWFDERFNLSIQPLLTKQNNVIPESVFKWWLRLQRENSPKDINKVIEELFEIISGDKYVLDPSPYRCRTCAVVGNSGNLKNSNYGPDIDKHDFILRMNHAPTTHYEMDVGSRTTHHFVYPESAKDLHENVSMIIIPFKILDLEWVISAFTNGRINFTYAAVPRKIRVNKEKVLVYSPELMKYIYDNWLLHHGRYPSTGILSVIFALHICDKVDLYGFGADSHGNWHHYWENNNAGGAFRQTGVHDGDFEADILANLSSINKVHLFSGR
ncbi:CMP-N-acetylneuraminate-beta-galactosamide-alpha-2,3-sialyltransferase 1 [Bombina bombina]|uniref:CMP-N-acetylneuraminate-beta-galactosamide- alpha-2,3-sialyltransferase 1 n=1 Tax=Bombina bombina TaxID=8345 RepID=UPI00235AA26D|nr:CMP-N-acetylneuraminate-beta-galactosamide-alpha-2,3-sialyltransferase 1 [Bombina bombina]XP_053571352.1 CMP-N-acetylneuraminate-beta-galactosamide-alpha-2,3-sialyltransferase 1 [Bombina bombina]